MKTVSNNRHKHLDKLGPQLLSSWNDPNKNEFNALFEDKDVSSDIRTKFYRSILDTDRSAAFRCTMLVAARATKTTSQFLSYESRETDENLAQGYHFFPDHNLSTVGDHDMTCPPTMICM